AGPLSDTAGDGLPALFLQKSEAAEVASLESVAPQGFVGASFSATPGTSEQATESLLRLFYKYQSVFVRLYLRLPPNHWVLAWFERKVSGRVGYVWRCIRAPSCGASMQRFCSFFPSLEGVTFLLCAF
ncbi:MAG: hypothetical protein ACLTL5_07575, partial [Oscillospiraceae bacterium]